MASGTLRGHHKGHKGHEGTDAQGFTFVSLVSFVIAAQLPTRSQKDPEFGYRIQGVVPNITHDEAV